LQNKKAIIVVGILTILTVMAFPVYALEPSEPHNANAMWIEPSTIDISGATVGYKFNVTFWANSSLETKGWQFWLTYPNAYINATRAGYTAGSKSEFMEEVTTMPITPSFVVNWNDTHNRLDYGEAWIMGPYNQPGYGSLCWVEFEVVALPPEGEPINIPLSIKWAYELYDPPKTYLLYSDGSYEPLDIYEAVVIPEFSMVLMLIALMSGTSLAVLLRKKRH
jgi:hypothetical protein